MQPIMITHYLIPSAIKTSLLTALHHEVNVFTYSTRVEKVLNYELQQQVAYISSPTTLPVLL